MKVVFNDMNFYQFRLDSDILKTTLRVITSLSRFFLFKSENSISLCINVLIYCIAKKITLTFIDGE